MLRCAPVEFDNKIDVAVFGVEIATRRRAEQIQPSHLEATAQRSQFLLVQLDFADHPGSAYDISTFTHVAACTLAPSSYFVTAIRGRQTFRHLYASPGCFRRERSPAGPCTHWKSAALSQPNVLFYIA